MNNTTPPRATRREWIGLAVIALPCLVYAMDMTVLNLAVPVMALLLLLGPRLLPEYRDPNAGGIDLLSVAQSLTAVLAVIYGLKRFAEHGLDVPSALIVAVGLGVGALFVRRQGTLAYPLLELKLFGQPRFAAAIAAYGLSCLAMFGVYIFITQYLQLVTGLSPLAAGLATLPWALGFIAGSLLAPRLARRWAAATILVCGLVAAAFGFALMLLLDDSARGLAMLVASTLVISLGMAPVFTIGNEMIITAAPHERAGAASAISETASEFSGALGIAVFGSVGMAYYRQILAAALPPSLGAQASADALATLGGALATSAALPAAAGEALRAAARAAFVDATQLAAAVGLVIVLLACAVTARILRGGRGGVAASATVVVDSASGRSSS
jgi:MFS transporter, DHA2 family, multidrug resistance protein